MHRIVSIKTDKYYLEQVWAPIIACIAGSINLICPNILSCKDPSIVVSKIIDISFIVFGFLLTILALILQSNQEIRKRKLYPRLIKLNKRILYIALASGGYSLLYNSIFEQISDSIFKEPSFTLFVLLFIWMILDLLYFIHIFYKLAEKREI